MLDNHESNEVVEDNSNPEQSDQITEEVVEESESVDDSSTEVEVNQTDENLEDTNESEDDGNQNKDHEALGWVKKRLAQKDRQINKRLREKDREISELRNQVSSIYKPVEQDVSSPPSGKIFDPLSGQYVDEESVDGKVIQKLQQMQQAETRRKQQLEFQSQLNVFNEKVETMKDKYEDYEDIVNKSKSYLTQTMVECIVSSPNSVEVFYNTLKENPKKLEEISKMPVAQQVKAMNFLEFQGERKVEQKLKSNAPKPITPIKPSTTKFVDDGSYEAILRKQREKQRSRFGE